MTIETVVAIAKTLHEGLISLSYFEDYDKPYTLGYGRPGVKIFEGNSWEDCLKLAGWNRDNSKPKTRKSTRSKTGWEG